MFSKCFQSSSLFFDQWRWSVHSTERSWLTFVLPLWKTSFSLSLSSVLPKSNNNFSESRKSAFRESSSLTEPMARFRRVWQNVLPAHSLRNLSFWIRRWMIRTVSLIWSESYTKTKKVSVDKKQCQCLLSIEIKLLAKGFASAKVLRGPIDSLLRSSLTPQTPLYPPPPKKKRKGRWFSLCSNTGSIRRIFYWTSKENRGELIELYSI